MDPFTSLSHSFFSPSLHPVYDTAGIVSMEVRPDGPWVDDMINIEVCRLLRFNPEAEGPSGLTGGPVGGPQRSD